MVAKTFIIRGSSMRYATILPTLLCATLLGSAVPAFAQNAPVEVRVDRLEKEMKAVQRKVFPGGTPLEAEISRPATPSVPPGAPSSAPIVDLTARVTALESQLATLTGQGEENSYKIKQLEAAFEKYKSEMESREAPMAATPALTGAATKPAATKPSAPASEERMTAVAGIEKPSTGDAAADAYTYGFRLWDAKFYPEAQAQLKAAVDQYGATSVGSRTQNLLGRAYLDDGKPALASVAFYENYQKRPRGDRAADSLAWLGEALFQLKKPADACKVYAELEQVYGATLSASLRGMVDKGRARAKCS